MNRRMIFTGVAGLALIAGAVPLAGLGVTAVAHSLAPRPTGAHGTPTSVATPGSTPEPAHAADPATPADPAASAEPLIDLPLAQRLRPLSSGDHEVTAQQLRDFAALYRPDQTAKSADAWAAETSIEVTCMAAAGFYWDPREINPGMTDPSQPSVPVTAAARLALDGDARMPYRWQDAGCRGRAIHETGTGD